MRDQEMQRQMLYTLGFIMCPISPCVLFSSCVCTHCRGLLMGLDCGLSEHEVLALGRSISECEQPEVDVGLMLAVAQDILKKKHFDELSHLARAFTYQDRHK